MAPLFNKRAGADRSSPGSRDTARRSRLVRLDGLPQDSAAGNIIIFSVCLGQRHSEPRLCRDHMRTHAQKLSGGGKGYRPAQFQRALLLFSILLFMSLMSAFSLSRKARFSRASCSNFIRSYSSFVGALNLAASKLLRD